MVKERKNANGGAGKLHASYDRALAAYLLPVSYEVFHKKSDSMALRSNGYEL